MHYLFTHVARWTRVVLLSLLLTSISVLGTANPIPVDAVVATRTVVTVPSFRLTTTVVTPTLTRNARVVVPLRIVRLNKYSLNPTLSVIGLPKGVTARLSRTTIASTATVTLQTNGTVGYGSYAFTIRAAKGRNIQNLRATLRIIQPSVTVNTPTAPSPAPLPAPLPAPTPSPLPSPVNSPIVSGPGTVSDWWTWTPTPSTPAPVSSPVSTPAPEPVPVPPTPTPVPPVTLPTPPTPPTPSVTPTSEALPSGAYNIGSPTLRDVWVDRATGNDANDGSQAHPLRTITAAWNLIPSGTLTGTGYRIMIKSGTYTDTQVPDNSWYEGRHGTYQFPVIFQAADGAGTVTLPNPNFYDNTYLYLIGLRVRANGGDILHCEKCSYVLIRQVTLEGVNHGPQEGLKINQSNHVYVENSDFSGVWDNALDFVAVQYGHIINNKIHDSQDWCGYTKGGSAYFEVSGNEFYNCGTGGFTAGQGSGFQWMTAPWINYEAYGIKIVNNVIHDTDGAGIGVNGGYNVLVANNTMYKVGNRDHVIEVVFGLRGCDGSDRTACTPNRNAGGWGPMVSDEDPIPNKNVYVYNNIVYNPAGYRSQWQQFAIYGPRTASSGTGITNPVRDDVNLQIKGNIIWNGPVDHPLGIEDGDQGCQPSNATCNATQLVADNAINTLQPQFVNAATGDFHLASGSNVLSATTFVPPTFAWNDLPLVSVPVGTLTNAVNTNRDGQARASLHAGAY